MKTVRVILLGSGDLACPLLKALRDAEGVELVGVVVQPDRPAGRGRKLLPCSVKRLAGELGVEVMESGDVSSEEMAGKIAGLAPDVLVVADFGQFLKENLLAVPRFGALNVHPSLLPKYRGASPVQWTLANGDKETGVCVLYVTPKMDAGDILVQSRTAILPEETAEALEGRLAEEGARLLLEALDAIRTGTVRAVAQDPAGVTLARKLKKEDGRLDWFLPAKVLVNRWRGFTPWPGVFTTLPDGTLLKVHRMRAEEGTQGGEAGTVLSCEGSGPLVAAGEGTVRLLEVQAAGKTRMDGAAFCRGRGVREGERLGGGACRIASNMAHKEG
jgi:methionyl-tRNA formyltransferase